MLLIMWNFGGNRDIVSSPGLTLFSRCCASLKAEQKCQQQRAQRRPSTAFCVRLPSSHPPPVTQQQQHLTAAERGPQEEHIFHLSIHSTTACAPTADDTRRIHPPAGLCSWNARRGLFFLLCRNLFSPRWFHVLIWKKRAETPEHHLHIADVFPLSCGFGKWSLDFYFLDYLGWKSSLLKGLSLICGYENR